jgi:chromate reductase, NAD(P)H dehydrogenase (quinone)
MTCAAFVGCGGDVTETKLIFFSGSIRKGSLNRVLATYAHRVAVEKGYAADLLELGDYPLPTYNFDLQMQDGLPENLKKLKARLDGYQGIFIASPEYNASVSALLKNVIDWLSRTKEDDGSPLQLFRSKVFAISSASPSMHGGARGLLALRQVLAVGLSALVLGDQFAVSKAHEAFDGTGKPKDELVHKTVAGIVDRLAFTAERFRP